MMRKMKLLDLDPLELARQLTLKESELFCKIRAVECLARAKEQGDNDNIRTIISMSNKVGALCILCGFIRSLQPRRSQTG